MPFSGKDTLGAAVGAAVGAGFVGSGAFVGIDPGAGEKVEIVRVPVPEVEPDERGAPREEVALLALEEALQQLSL